MKTYILHLFFICISLSTWGQTSTNYSLSRGGSEGSDLTVTKSVNGNVTSIDTFYGQDAENKYNEFSSSNNSSDSDQNFTPNSNKTSQNYNASFTSQDIQVILQAHNKERKVFGESNLIWNSEIANYAQEWAKYLANRDQGLTHRQKSGYGENIALHYSNNPAYGVDLWNEEKKDFVYEPIGNTLSKTLHYTQVIWRNTREVGCGWAQGASGVIYFVCNYNPPGNYMGQRPY
jgi:hypothetical protein